MKEPKRLLWHGASDFERELLRAVASERPSTLLRSRMQRSLGLVGPLAWASNVKAMFGNVGSKLTGGRLASSKVAVGATMGVAMGLAVAGGVATYRFFPGAALHEAPSAAAPAPLPSADGLALDTAAPDTALVPAPAPAAPATVPAAAADSQDGRLREEIALLDGVKSALSRGDREQARQSLDTYRERFPEGILRREANVLRRRAETKPSRASEGTSYED